ncbi:HNH endonuclease [Actomonas aquatica]|uniref:HNH endonuclease n=1 Tax=Actomonas aquatica TaxID=2866162 RepID=A0ABZ1CEL7_9BACT|nr:HNH endonuclease [Opitutus sp. WL0086]WRQ90131.1 HNH endonuclease [Opitutus sp. WL0086]
MVPLVGAVAELLGVDDAIPESTAEWEGGIKESVVRKRERSRRNRLLCISIHGRICKVCGFDPVTVYGPDGSQIIEVHHIEPLSESSAPRPYDPASDLIPLCPNCHRAIHCRVPAFSPDELRSLMGIS